MDGPDPKTGSRRAAAPPGWLKSQSQNRTRTSGVVLVYAPVLCSLHAACPPSPQTATMASYLDIALDDFDPPLVYPDQSQWSTPDPSLNPARFNQSTTDDGGWSQGTYHFTDVVGAKVGLNFTGAYLEPAFFSASSCA